MKDRINDKKSKITCGIIWGRGGRDEAIRDLSRRRYARVAEAYGIDIREITTPIGQIFLAGGTYGEPLLHRRDT